MISFVFAGRNDHHGFVYDRGGPQPRFAGDFADKVKRVLTWNLEVISRAESGVAFPRAEYVFVEWGRYTEPGAPEPRPWLGPELVKLFAPRVRAYLVTDEVVAKLQAAPVVFHEYIAKNIGIARSGQSRLVVATNSDVLYSTPITEALLRWPVADNVLYRAPRWDFVPKAGAGYSTLDPAWPPPEGDAFFAAIDWSNRVGGPAAWGNAAGDFAAATPAGWGRLGGYIEAPNRMRHLDSELIEQCGRCGINIVEMPPVWHRDHPDSSQYWDWLPELGGDALTNERQRFNEKRGWGGKALVEQQVEGGVWELSLPMGMEASNGR